MKLGKAMRNPRKRSLGRGKNECRVPGAATNVVSLKNSRRQGERSGG